MNDEKKNQKKQKQASSRLRVSIMLFLIALASVSAVTVAWFSISDNARIRSMNMDITTGVSMRFDLDEHGSYEEYIETLGFDQISGRMQSTLGFDMLNTPLEPVTTSDAEVFTLEDGSIVEETSGSYLSFMLHFIAQKDMVVHLTSEDSDEKAGTLITSDNPALVDAMRISFTADGTTYVYDPGNGDSAYTSGTMRVFGLPGGAMVYNDNNSMFSLKENEDKPVEVHVWLEGNDENCTNDLKGAQYSIALKFQGTDENNQPFEDAKRPEKEDNVKEDGDKEYFTQREDTADQRDEDVELTFFQKIKKVFIEVFIGPEEIDNNDEN